VVGGKRKKKGLGDAALGELNQLDKIGRGGPEGGADGKDQAALRNTQIGEIETGGIM
jgi:hypothetical protein